MAALQIIKELNSKNITLSVDGGLLRYKAPACTMTDETIRLLKEHKTQLIEALRAKQTMPAITVQKMDVCLHGSMCRFISLVDDRQICSRNNKAIFDIAACPDGRWRKSKLIDKANTVQPTRCYSCGGVDWWLSIYGKYICTVCHPPANESLVKRKKTYN